MKKAKEATEAKEAKETSDSEEDEPADTVKSDAEVPFVDSDDSIHDAGLPSYSHEGSRRQYMVRSGKKGKGETFGLKYENAIEKVNALKKAKKLCRKMCAERGICIPDRF